MTHRKSSRGIVRRIAHHVLTFYSCSGFFYATNIIDAKAVHAFATSSNARFSHWFIIAKTIRNRLANTLSVPRIRRCPASYIVIEPVWNECEPRLVTVHSIQSSVGRVDQQ